MQHLMCLLLSQDGNTPLHIAAIKNMSAVVDVLLKSKANADCVNKVLLECTHKQCTVIHKRLGVLWDKFLIVL